MHHVTDQYRVPVILWVTGVIIRVMSVTSWLDDNSELVSINHYGIKETAFVSVRYEYFVASLKFNREPFIPQKMDTNRWIQIELRSGEETFEFFI